MRGLGEASEQLDRLVTSSGVNERLDEVGLRRVVTVVHTDPLLRSDGGTKNRHGGVDMPETELESPEDAIGCNPGHNEPVLLTRPPRFVESSPALRGVAASSVDDGELHELNAQLVDVPE